MSRNYNFLSLVRACCLVLGLCLLISCADKKEEPYGEIESKALGAWIAQNEPAMLDSMTRSGMYVERLEGPSTDSIRVEVGDWILLEYTSTTLQGNVFRTRSETVAREQGTFDAHTHYVPATVYVNDPNTTMTPGEREILLGSSPGASYRLIMPSSLAFGVQGYSNNVGYGGQATLGSGMPVIETIELVEVIRDPAARERRMVNQFARQEWGLDPADTLHNYFYYDVLEKGEDTPLGNDSVVTVHYVGKFLDGFVFDTNVDSISLQHFQTPAAKSYEGVKLSNVTGNAIQAWKDYLPQMHYGELSRIVFTSPYGYGTTGKEAQNTSNSTNLFPTTGTGTTPATASITTEIPPYTPLIFEIRVSREAADAE